jgi:hypothetical protein
MNEIKSKNRVTYVLEESYGGKWSIRIFSNMNVESAEEGLATIKSMYMLEDPDEVDASIEVKGNVAVDLILGLGK